MRFWSSTIAILVILSGATKNPLHAAEILRSLQSLRMTVGAKCGWHVSWAMGLLLCVILAGCTQPPPSTPTPAATPLPPVGSAASPGGVKAAGRVTPRRQAVLAFPVGGRLIQVAAAVGDQVPAGGLLATLEGAGAEAAVVQARAALFRAQANLAELQAGPRPQTVAALQARLDAATARLSQLTEGARPEAIGAARAELAAAQAGLQQLSAGPLEEDRIAALAALANAKAALRQAQSAYDQVSSRNDVGMLPESRQLQEASNNYEAAQARYDALFAGPTADRTAAARASVQRAAATLALLQAPASPGQIAEADAQVRAVQAELDLLSAGAGEATLASTAVAVTEAEAVLQRAEAELANLQLRAPFTGTVAALDGEPGEMVQASQVVATLADLSQLQVETTDLSERDVARVAEGQAAAVFVEALGVTLAGHVTRIAPLANIIGGDVVYAVTVRLDEIPPGLRWGMSAEVEIENGTGP